MDEEWKPVTGWEGLYEVSNLGRVRGVDRHVMDSLGRMVFKRGAIVKGYTNDKGYRAVKLSRLGKKKTAVVHGLVAKHFLPPSDFDVVNHKDLNKLNNRVDNLEWTTRLLNVEHALLAGAFTAAVNPGRAKKLSIEKVLMIHVERATGKSSMRIAKQFGVCQSTIQEIISGDIWKCCFPSH